MPQGATCKLVRDGVNVGMVLTPGSAIVKRGSPEIKADCEKDGYQTASVTKTPGMNGWFFGNIIFGGLIGIIVDAADGAAFSYGDFEAIPLTPVTAKSVPIPEEPGKNPQPIAPDLTS